MSLTKLELYSLKLRALILDWPAPKMFQATKTIKAIDKLAVDTQEPPHRAHLGASIIGDECARKLWYLFRWTLAERHEGRMLRLFNRGHLEETRFIGWLRGLGVQIWEVNPDNGKQWRISDHEGHFGGSLDGVGLGLPDLSPSTPFLCEFKTHNAKSFGKLVTDGLLRTKWKHFVQMQVYMFKMDLSYAAYFAVNKDNDDLCIEIIDRDPREGQRAIDRAANIIWTPEPLPRISKTPSHFACQYCHLQRLCHFGDVTPDRNCRTCVHSRPAPGGVWECTNEVNYQAFGDNVPLDEAAQHAGCDLYTVNPRLIGRQP